MKKLAGAVLSALALVTLVSCGSKNKDNNGVDPKNDDGNVSFTETDLNYINDKGYAGINDNLPDFSQYVGTQAYRKVSNASELIVALNDARTEYTNNLISYVHNGDASDYSPLLKTTIWKKANWEKFVKKGLYVLTNGEFIKVPEDTPWDPEGTTYTSDMAYYEDSRYATVDYEQVVTKEASVHVIEITANIDLGYKKLSAEDKAYTSIVSNFGDETKEANFKMSDMYNEYGMTQINVERTSNLLIYSKNGAKLTHGGFGLNYVNNVVIRNLEFDEMWQWEDQTAAQKQTAAAKVGDYDAFAWAYFKIGFCGNVWIDHCEFGKSYDGQIDVSNPCYNSINTYTNAPYGADGSSAVHISWCDFKSGFDDPNGYLYKMMAKIEEEYKDGKDNYVYYNALRDGGATFEDILYGIAIPQKKAFLDGDNDEFKYNRNLRVSIGNCRFTNVEDRIPKVRGGVAYMYNTLVDCDNYYAYRTKLKDLNAASLVSAVSSIYKCGLVSQCLVCGAGGNVAYKNVEIRGVQQILKNNDDILKNEANVAGATLNGGYNFINVSSRLTPNDAVKTSGWDNASPTTLTEANFNWLTADGKAPFDVADLDLSNLSSHLSNEKYGVGTSNYQDFINLLTTTR